MVQHKNYDIEWKDLFPLLHYYFHFYILFFTTHSRI